MADYPDWTRLFWLFGTTITIPINIESSDIVLSVSIDAVTTTVDVKITASEVTLAFSFADQSVAVFDAAKWFAHEADQFFVQGGAAVASGGSAILCSSPVPTKKVAFIVGVGYGVEGASAELYSSYFTILIAAAIIVRAGSQCGMALIFDTPIRATAGQLIELTAYQTSPGAVTMRGTFWGYEEDE